MIHRVKEWEDEPDHVEFNHAGLNCQIKRMKSMGHLCGYVQVLEGHPTYKRGLQSGEFNIDVHGGITFSDEISKPVGPNIPPFKTKTKRLHLVYPGWWHGFDCAHAGDHSPGIVAMAPNTDNADDFYRNIDYVRKQTESLAEQLAKIGS